MAHKLKCPNCEKYLREEGDEGKSGDEYRVYESLPNCKYAGAAFRRIECLACGHMGEVDSFDG